MMGSKGQNSRFPEHGHIAYQIKGNHECSIMVANIFRADLNPRTHPHPPLTLGVGSKSQNSTFSEHRHVVFQIKMNHKCTSIVANILPQTLIPNPQPWGGPQGQNASFSEHGHVAIQIKGNHECSKMVANILPATTPPSGPWGGVNRSKFNFLTKWSCYISN